MQPEQLQKLKMGTLPEVDKSLIEVVDRRRACPARCVSLLKEQLQSQISLLVTDYCCCVGLIIEFFGFGNVSRALCNVIYL